MNKVVLILLILLSFSTIILIILLNFTCDKYDKNFSVLNDIVHFRFDPKKYQKQIDTLSKIDYIDKSVNFNLLPPIYKHFDYIIQSNNSDYKKSGNPKNAKIVYCDPNIAIKYNFSEINNLRPGEKRVLITMGSDKHSSKLDISSKKYILEKFSTVFWEANTDPDFLTLPMGLTTNYFARQGVKNINNAIIKAKKFSQRKLCCIPTWNKISIGLKVPSRSRLEKYINKYNTNHWFDITDWHPTNYYDSLAKYKFCVCPTGNGLQAPKIFEALVVRTIPIVEDEFVFRQLKELGIPLVIVKKWDDLSPAFLEQKWKDMKVDWDKVIYLLSVKGIMNLIYQYLK